MARSLKKNFAYQATWQVLLILTPLVTTPYLSRVLGADGVGEFSFTQSIANYFVLVAALGMSTHGVRAVAACGGDRAQRSRVFWNAYASQFAVGFTAAVLYALYAALAPAASPAATWVWGLWVLSAVLDVSWLLFGCEEFKLPTVVSIATKLASLVVIFGFVRGPGDLPVYVAAIAGSFLANQLLLWPLLGRFVGWCAPTLHGVFGQLKPSIALFVPVVAISLYTSLDKILLGSMAGMGQTGFFEYSEKLARMPLSVVTALGTVMLPRMAAELGAGRRGRAVGFLEESMWAMLAAAFALAFGICAVAPELAPVFLGEGFAECDVLMAVLAWTVPLVSVTNVLGRQWLVPTGRDRAYTLSVCAGAAVNVGLNLALIPRYGALGCAVATVAAEAAVLAAQAVAVRGELPLLRWLTGAAPFAGCGALMFGAVRLLAGVLDAAWGMTALGLALEVLAGVAVFCALALAWCLTTHDPHLQVVLGQVRRRG